MPAADLTQFTIAGRKWVGRERYADFIAGFASDPDSFFRGEAHLVSDRKLRAIAVVPVDAGTRAHVKKYKGGGLIPRLRLMLGASQADREYANIISAAAAGLPVPELICFGRHGGCAYLATVFIPSARPLVEILRDKPEALDDALINDIADLVARMHEAGFVHQDLHLGNILVDDARSLHLVDLHRALSGVSVSDEEAAENLGQFDFSLSRVTDRERRNALIDAYLRIRAIGKDRASFADAVFAAGRAWGRRHFMSRTRRCTRDSGEFAAEKRHGLTVYRRRAFTGDVEHIIREHHRVLAENKDGILKEGRKTRLTVPADAGGEGRICVKEFRGRGLSTLFELIARGRRGLRAWQNANGLLARGIPTPRTLAYASAHRTLSGGEYLITRYEEDARPLDVYLREEFGHIEDRETLHAKWKFMHAAGLMLARLHGAEVFHKDFKANNILVAGQEEAPRPALFLLLDVDRMRFDEPLSRDEAEFNIACLNAAVADFITMADRLRAFKAYSGRKRLSREDREMIRRIVRISIARDHFWQPLSGRRSGRRVDS